MYKAELHELVRERGGGVPARHGARELAVHLVVHAQEYRHLGQSAQTNYCLGIIGPLWEPSVTLFI